MDYLVWTLVIALLLVGLVGSVVPLLPGTTLMLAGALIQKWLLPDTLSWLAIGWIGGFWLFSLAADLACTLLGVRVFGGTKWGMAGASGGALVGMLYSFPALLLGTLIGAVVAEKWFGQRTHEEALRSGAGAALGFLFSTFVRFGCALAIAAIYILAVLPARAS
jgi:uncharacterized protein YqgC (DUF456 family)